MKYRIASWRLLGVFILACCVAWALVLSDAFAQRGGGGRGGGGRGGGSRSGGARGGGSQRGAPSSVRASRGAGAPSSRRAAPSSVRQPSERRGAGVQPGAAGARETPRATTGETRRDVSRDISRDIERDASIESDIDVEGDWDDDWDVDVDDDWDGGEFIAGAAVGAVTGAVVSDWGEPDVVVVPSTIVSALPAGCAETVVNNTVYYQCDSVYYQPQYYGSSLQYVVVSPP